ncbi:hypothetical protein [Methanobrevibacter curvatus]|uniref:hypothetical protein n=1 Tax=Methanobrevibacter curvatus TaxID=49547 RepID=UPI0012ED3166|nr:hypothetical protein [Methanobrevibacter curvatus]
MGIGIFIANYNCNNQTNDNSINITKKNTTNIDNNTNHSQEKNTSKQNTKKTNTKSTPKNTSEPILITKKQALKIAKTFLIDEESAEGISSKATFITHGKQHYWIIKVYDYCLYIDAKTGDSVNPKLVGII